jgi:hypothetical protein
MLRVKQAYLLACCIKPRPNPPFQLMPLRVGKIGAFLAAEIARTSFRSLGRHS